MNAKNKKSDAADAVKAKTVVSISSLRVKNPVKTAEVRRREQMKDVKGSKKS